ncbi:hypothetical protein MN116_005562 [Schistosoma mekongi]|uniref:Uncharacterized protein n=1 Tax=Schistosoma mekongi TaxID=38744 RepID=A0AAE1ZD09_SCHME|nr:hypothetical protein MN116_005562 [Schistosoma mekongi]
MKEKLTICMSLESGILSRCLNFWWKIAVWVVAMVLFSIITIISVIMTINLSDYFKSLLFYCIITTIITVTLSIDAYFTVYHEFVVNIIGIGMTISYSPIWLYLCQMSIGNFHPEFIDPFFSAELLYFVLMFILYITDIEFIILCRN